MEATTERNQVGYSSFLNISMSDWEILCKVRIFERKHNRWHEFTHGISLSTQESPASRLLGYLESRFGAEIKDPSNIDPITISMFDGAIEIQSKLEWGRKIFKTIVRSRLDRAEIDPALLHWVVSGLQLYYDESNIRS